MQMHRRNLARHKAMLLAERTQQADVAAASMAETEFRANPDFARAQPGNQRQPHEIFRTHLGQATVETDHAHAVGAEPVQAFDLGACQGQTRRRRGGCEELARQRLEAHRHCRHTECAGTCHSVLHQRPMPQMQAIEGADADHASAREQRPALDVSKQPAHSSIQTDAGRPALVDT